MDKEKTLNIYKKLFEVKKAGIKLQRDTKAFNYKYATLSQIQEKLSGELDKQGLLVIHSIKDNKVLTRIVDIEASALGLVGVESEIEMSEGIKAQDKGSEITYYRRYNLLSLLDLEVEDDDGAKAQGRDDKQEDKRDKTKEVLSGKHAGDNWFNPKDIDIIKDMLGDGELQIDGVAEFINTTYSVSKVNAEKLNVFIKSQKENLGN